MRFLIDFINLNNPLKFKPYPIPKINDILLKFECFHYAMLLDLNTLYYNIQLTEDASNLFTIILQWIKYCYKRIPMGVSNSSDIFQLKIKKLFQVF